MARKSKRDWLVTGVLLLAEVGPAGITIDALCQKLDVTKGSFYHHFQNYEDFKVSFLNFYEEEGTLDIIERLQDVPTATEKLRSLLDIIIEETSGTAVPEIQLRAWAIQDDLVREVQTRVDSQRIAYVEALLLEIFNDAAEARQKALTLYAILVGAEQMQPPVLNEGLRALFDEYLASIDID